MSRCVAPPKSWEDAHTTSEQIDDLGVPTLNQPRFGSSYPSLCDLGELALHLTFLGPFMTYLMNT